MLSSSCYALLPNIRIRGELNQYSEQCIHFVNKSFCGGIGKVMKTNVL